MELTTLCNAPGVHGRCELPAGHEGNHRYEGLAHIETWSDRKVIWDDVAPTLTTWRTLIADEMAAHNETWADVVACTATDEILDYRFEAGAYGIAYLDHVPTAFTLWTGHRVYFPYEYDGRLECHSVPRNPCGEAIEAW